MARAIVTGGNRGIGREICKELHDLGHDVILTARDEKKGKDAANELGVKFMLLDVESPASVQAFAKAIAEAYDQIDVLINNAGVFLDKDRGAHEVDFDILYKTMEINTWGAWRLILALLPSFEKSTDPRVINMSSGLGAINEMSGGYPSYRMSKVAMNAMTKMLASDLQGKLTINSMCPGWVRTDMGGQGASRSVETGAETAVWLATNEKIPNGKFLRDKTVIDW